MKKPCSNCPFLKTAMPGWLGRERATEAAQSALTDTTFHCHKTIKYNDDAAGKVTDSSQPCAGSVLLAHKEGGGNRYYRMVMHREQIKGSERVVDSVEEFIALHSK